MGGKLSHAERARLRRHEAEPAVYWRMEGPLADTIRGGDTQEAYLPAWDFPPYNGYVMLVPVDGAPPRLNGV